MENKTFQLPIEKYERIRYCVEKCYSLLIETYENLGPDLPEIVVDEFLDNMEAYQDVIIELDNSVPVEYKEKLGIIT